MSLFETINICLDDIGFKFYNPMQGIFGTTGYWKQRINNTDIIINFDPIADSSQIFDKNTLSWYINCDKYKDIEAIEFIKYHKDGTYKNVMLWIYIQQKQGFYNVGEMCKPINIDTGKTIIDGCCLFCKKSFDGCWCEKCECKSCDDYIKCSCGKGKGYCSRVNNHCIDCKKKYEDKK